MMVATEDKTKYPIGKQSFELLRNEGCVYVDKTRYIYDMAHCGSTTFFLSRPRRFGKSLLLSTCEAYFQGRKELFDGLELGSLEKEWTSYPVLHFDFSMVEAAKFELLETYINKSLEKFSQKYGVPLQEGQMAVGTKFGYFIEDLSQACGKKIVILVDEYDKGITEVLDHQEMLEANQSVLNTFFAQLKSYDRYLRFCLITGVARFRHYTLFSGFNNPDDISMESHYAAICGVTREELISNFKSGIQALASKYGMSESETIEALISKYDGYRFSRDETLVLNPFSLLNCLKKQDFANYWVKSGTIKLLMKYLANSDFQLTDLDDLWASAQKMEEPFSVGEFVPLLYQTGYLTIKEVSDQHYRLGIPNAEVNTALIEELLPKFAGIKQSVVLKNMQKLSQMVHNGDIDGFMLQLQSLISSIPYQELDYKDLEKTYHLAIYMIFMLIDINTRSEISMAGGRIDMVATTDKYVFVFEFKLGGSPADALAQIEEKGYALPWKADGRKVYKIGAVFSLTTHTVDCWEIIEPKG